MYIEKAKRWRKENWPKAKAQLKEQQRRNPEKARARGALKKAVHDGRVEKPTACSICEVDLKERRLIHGHHADYTKALALDPNAALAVLRAGVAEPDRVGGDVPAARGAGRSVPAEAARRSALG